MIKNPLSGKAADRSTPAKWVKKTGWRATVQAKVLGDGMHNYLKYHYPTDFPKHLASANLSPGFSVSETMAADGWNKRIKSKIPPPFLCVIYVICN